MVYKEHSFLARDGAKLNVHRWIPNQAKSAIVLSHGWSEHAGRYGQLAKWFALNGFEVHALDHRGHGKSEGLRGHIDCWSIYADDLETFRNSIDQERQFLMGHSMGGMIAIKHMLTYPRRFEAAVLSGPATDVSYAVPKAKIILSRLLSKYLPKIRFDGGVDPQLVCANQAIVEDYQSDPLNHGKASARWFAEYLDLIQQVKDRAGEIDTPVAIWHGEYDKIVEPWVSEQLFESLGADDKQRTLVTEAKHEILFEENWERTASDMTDWFRAFA